MDARMVASYRDQFLTSPNHPRCMGVSPGSSRCDATLENGASQHGGSDGYPDGQGSLMVAEPKVQTKRPPMYKVILLNDDYTPMEFVVTVLEQIFRRPHADALNVMLEVHQKGAGTAGIYTRDVAETKADQVVEYARINDYPLQCTLEPE